MKILKLFISLSLILSVSLVNSLAAISVSDGSAFVTKAEFAADLNNLSNRMSSLENSLDVKIDSLVSSYLSRNGIWNGEKQTFLDYTEEKLWPNKWANSSSGDETITNDKVIICKISKAGLANFNFSLIGTNGLATNKTTHGTIIYFQGKTDSGGKGVFTLRYEIGESDNIYYSNNFFIGSVLNPLGFNKSLQFFVPSSIENNLFFVDKGVDLWIRLISITEGSNYNSSFILKTGYQSYYNPKMKFNYLNIY